MPPLKVKKDLSIDISMLNKLPGSMWYLWSKFVIFRKIKTILILISFKRYFSRPEKSILNLNLP